jgi:hypothetical protein
MKNAMDHEEDQHLHCIQAKPARLAVSGFNRNDQIPQEIGVKGAVFSLSHWKGKDVGGLVSLKISTIEFPNLGIID